jgi:xanthine dehydrogenase small subunit
MSTLRFNLNGQWVEETQVSPTTTLLRWLRERRGLTGTKEGCAEGDCGACTVAVVEQGPDGQPVYRAVNACLLFLPMLQGKHVVTVEGLQTGDTLHPAQASMATCLGSQCGFCTPGVVMSLFEATYREDLDAPWKLDDQLCGNLCRCTGYRPIREAALEVAGTRPVDRFTAALPASAPEGMALDYQACGQHFVTPTSFEALFAHLDREPQARFVSGGTDLGLEVTKRFAAPPSLVSLEGLAALKQLSASPTHFTLGAGATISELEAFTATRLPPVARMVRYFGSRQVKHRGTVGGNLCSASPIGDLAPVLLSLGAVAVLRSAQGERRVPLEQFFVGYRKTALQPKELLAAVEVPRLQASDRALAYKVSKRRELDISAVSAGLWARISPEQVVLDVRFAWGGLAPTPTRSPRAEAALRGQPLDDAHLEAAVAALGEDVKPLSDHRGSADYRLQVAKNLLRAFFEETAHTPQPSLEPQHVGAAQELPHV